MHGMLTFLHESLIWNKFCKLTVEQPGEEWGIEVISVKYL